MYRVRWEIDLPADNPLEAARKAQQAMRRPGTTATVFDVTDRDGKTTRVDLCGQESGVCPTHVGSAPAWPAPAEPDSAPQHGKE